MLPLPPSAPIQKNSSGFKRFRRSLAKATRKLRDGLTMRAVRNKHGIASAAVAAIAADDRPALEMALAAIRGKGQLDGPVAGLLLDAVTQQARPGMVDLVVLAVAQCLDEPGWPPEVTAPLLALHDRDLARSMRTAIASAPYERPGSLALDACLSIAAGAPLKERISLLYRLERLAPELCEERPVRAFLRSLPQSRGVLDARGVTATLNNAGERVLVVAGADLDLADLDALPAASAITLTAYRPVSAVLERWRQDIAAKAAQDRIQVVHSLQHDSDLNDAFHRQLSNAADQLANVIMNAPEIAVDSDLRSFRDRHGEAGAIRLSDRLFAWMRVHAAFIQILRLTRPTLVVLLDAGEEAGAAAYASTMLAPPAILEVRTGRSLRNLERLAGAEVRAGPGNSFALNVSVSLTEMINQGRSAGTEARRCWTAETSGALLSTRSSLHAPIAQRLMKALGTSVVDLSHLLERSGETPRPIVCDISPSRVADWLEEAGISRAAGLAIDVSAFSDLLTVIIRRFIEFDLVRLVQVDAVTAGAVQACSAQFAVILPTRHPELRVAARNFQAYGTKVHEVQAVYLSEMPRYKAPLVDRYHALDTFSAAQVQHLFNLPAPAIRAGGTLRPFSLKSRVPRSPDAPFRVTLATQPEPMAQSLARLSETLTALRMVRTPCSLVLRCHPAEGALRLDAYRDALEQSGFNARFGGDLMHTDLLVAGFSNLIMEAAVAGIRVATHLPQGPSPLPYDLMGIAHKTSNPGSLADFMDDCAENGPLSTGLDASRGRYLAQNPFLGRPDEAAAAIAADILRDARP